MDNIVNSIIVLIECTQAIFCAFFIFAQYTFIYSLNIVYCWLLHYSLRAQRVTTILVQSGPRFIGYWCRLFTPPYYTYLLTYSLD